MYLFLLEIRKLLKTKGIGISIAIMLLCMVLNAANNTGMLNRFKTDILVEETENFTEYQKALFDKFNGTKFSETVYQEMLAEYNSLYDGTDPNAGEEKGKYGPSKRYDRYIYSSVLAIMEYLQSFDEDLDNLIKNAEQIRANNRDLGKYKDAYTEKEAAAVIEAYSNIRNNLEPELHYTSSAFWYCFSSSEGANSFNHQLLLIFICCIITIYFTSEYESKMNQMTYTAYKGQLHLFVQKSKIVFIAAIFITIFSCLVDMALISLHMGRLTDMLGLPIQLICDSNAGPVAKLCPFNISFGQYIFLSGFMKFTALYFASNICVLISVWFRSGTASSAASILLNVGLLQFTIYASQRDLTPYEQKSEALNKIFIWLKTYSPLSLLWSKDYIATYDTVRFFNTPVYRIYFALIFAWILIAAILAVNAWLYCRRSTSHEIRIDKYIKKIRKSRSAA